jgi:WD40 repeat protein
VSTIVYENDFFNRFQNSLAIYRIDLRTGKIAATLQPFHGDVIPGYAVSFSPSDKYLTYVISDSVRDVHVYNLQTGDIFTITIDTQYDASGKFEWSPDGNKAIFVAAKSGWGSETPINNGISCFLLDLKTRSSNHLFDQQDMYRVSWTQDGNIVLHDVSGDNGLLYNFQSNTFTSVTPTPAP